MMMDVTTASPQEPRHWGGGSRTDAVHTHRVRQNLAFPLLARAFRRGEISKRVAAESRALNIDHILERWPADLSAGEQQLAQIARALVRVPRVFLMDEPLANLDPPTKRKLREELVRLQRGYGVTTIYVATRPSEIRTMPDKVVALEHGRVVQVATPNEVQAMPATKSVAELTGPIGWLRGKVEVDAPGFAVAGTGFRLRGWAPQLGELIGTSVTVGVRPADVEMMPNGDCDLVAAGTTYDGPTVLRELRCESGVLLIANEDLQPGDRLQVSVRSWLLYDENGRLILKS